MDVPADEVDGRQRRHGAAGVRTDELVGEQRADLARELGALIHHLEADAITGEGGGIEDPHHLAPEPDLAEHVDELDQRRIGVAARDQLGPDDHVRGIEEVQPHEMLAERLAASLAERIDRQTRSHGRHDRIGPARRLDLVEDLPLQRHVLGQRLKDEIRARHGASEIVFVVAGRGPVRDGRGADLLDRGREALVGLRLRAGEQDHFGHRRREQRRTAVAHRAVRAEHDHALELPAGEDLPQLRGGLGSRHRSLSASVV